jgi:hypothetical protein
MAFLWGARPGVRSIAHSNAEECSHCEDIVSRSMGVARVCLPIRDLHGSYRGNVTRQRDQVGFRHRFGDPAFLVFIPPSVIANGASSSPVSSMPLAGRWVSTETFEVPRSFDGIRFGKATLLSASHLMSRT